MRLLVLPMRRPLRVVIDDCRMLVDLDARNAAWVAVAQLTSAFKMPARWRRPAPPPELMGEDLPHGAGRRADADGGLKRGWQGPGAGGEAGGPGWHGARISRRASMPVSPSMEGGGELLRMLLRQNAVRNVISSSAFHLFCILSAGVAIAGGGELLRILLRQDEVCFPSAFQVLC